MRNIGRLDESFAENDDNKLDIPLVEVLNADGWDICIRVACSSSLSFMHDLGEQDGKRADQDFESKRYAGQHKQCLLMLYEQKGDVDA